MFYFTLFKGVTMKCLFVSSIDIESKDNSGGKEGSLKAFKLLQKYYGNEEVKWYRFNIKTFTRVQNIIKIFAGNKFSIYKSAKEDILEFLNHGVEVLYMDYAYGGEFIKLVKAKYPKIKIIKFFHDINYFKLTNTSKKSKFFSIRGDCKLKLLNIKKEVNRSEYLSIKHSDSVGCLHSRDSELIKNYYNRQADFLLPVSFERSDLPKVGEKVYNDGKNLLFVGLMSYFPNYEAALFFATSVMPKLKDFTFNIVGSKSLDYKMEFEVSDNVKVLGRVDDLAQYYLQADAVVAPILSGGGMKVKVCEAMQYGKTIFGTDEAFAGYDVDFDKIGGLCNNIDEFVLKITQYFEKNSEVFNEYSRKVFLDKYTNDAAFTTIAKVLDGLQAK